MPYERDPLSVRYDQAAGQLLGRALASRRQWVYTTVAQPRPGPKTLEWLRARGIRLASVDEGGLTPPERAMQRALYWNAKQLGISTQRGSAWLIVREWGPVTSGGRLLGIRVMEANQARRVLPDKPASERWDKSGSARSGGIGSPWRRFA